MSKTPRTDAAKRATEDDDDFSHADLVYANFAEQLETELHDARSALAESRTALKSMLSDGGPISDPVSRKQANEKARAALAKIAALKPTLEPIIEAAVAQIPPSVSQPLDYVAHAP